jgi:O-antigen/teichoic acid export membrane protein
MAHGLGPATTLFMQVVSVPLLITHWGINIYGEWLLLSAIPVYLVMCDLGVERSSANEMVMACTNGDRKKAVALFQSASVFILAIAISVMLIIVLVVLNFDFRKIFNISQITQYDSSIIILSLSVVVLLNQQEGLIAAAFRCEGKYAYGIFLLNIVRVAESMGVIAMVLIGGSAKNVAIIMAIVHIVGIFFLRISLKKVSPWINYGKKYISIGILKEITKPSLGFALIPLAGVMSIQGISIIIGSILGPVVLATYSVVRTYARSGYIIIGLLVNSTIPEITTAYAEKKYYLVKDINKKLNFICLSILLVINLLLLSFGPEIIHLWTKGNINIDRYYLGLILIAIQINYISFIGQSVLSGMNKNLEIGFFYLILSILNMISAYIIVQYFYHHVYGVLIITILFEMIGAFYIIKKFSNYKKNIEWSGV